MEYNIVLKIEKFTKIFKKVMKNLKKTTKNLYNYEVVRMTYKFFGAKGSM